MKFSWGKSDSKNNEKMISKQDSSIQAAKDTNKSAKEDTNILRLGINDFERDILVKELRDAKNYLIEEFPFSKYTSESAFSVYSATTRFDFAISLFSNLSMKVEPIEMSGTIQVLRATEDRILEKIGTAVSKEEVKEYKVSGLILMKTKAQLLASVTKISQDQMKRISEIFSLIEGEVSKMAKLTKKQNSDKTKEIYKTILSGVKKSKKNAQGKRTEKLNNNEKLGIFTQLLEMNLYLSDPLVIENPANAAGFNLEEIEQISTFLYRKE